MTEEILTEITNFCEECPSHECCPEEECVLYRIEQILTKKEPTKEQLEGQTDIYDYI